MFGIQREAIKNKKSKDYLPSFSSEDKSLHQQRIKNSLQILKPMSITLVSCQHGIRFADKLLLVFVLHSVYSSLVVDVNICI